MKKKDETIDNDRESLDERDMWGSSFGMTLSMTSRARNMGGGVRDMAVDKPL